MSRCRICGRPPTEECCTRCHAVEAHLRHEAKDAQRQRGLATYRANFGYEEVNTEEVNQ